MASEPTVSMCGAILSAQKDDAQTGGIQFQSQPGRVDDDRQTAFTLEQLGHGETGCAGVQEDLIVITHQVGSEPTDQPLGFGVARGLGPEGVIGHPP